LSYRISQRQITFTESEQITERMLQRLLVLRYRICDRYCLLCQISIWKYHKIGTFSSCLHHESEKI